jgi:hypothetical protein
VPCFDKYPAGAEVARVRRHESVLGGELQIHFDIELVAFVAALFHFQISLCMQTVE